MNIIDEEVLFWVFGILNGVFDIWLLEIRGDFEICNVRFFFSGVEDFEKIFKYMDIEFEYVLICR